MGDIEFDIVGYRGSLNEKWEDDWVVLKAEPGCKVNRMRGVKYMELKIGAKGKDGSAPKMGYVQLGEEIWFMNK